MSSPNFDHLLDRSDIEVDIATLAPIGSGLSSSVFGNDVHVVKLLKNGFQTEVEANDYADVLYAEQGRITDYMGVENVAQAHFVVSRAIEGAHRLSVVQPRVIGVTMAEALREGGSSDGISSYLEKGLRMYARRKEIPDLACVEHRFDPLSDPNTQVMICNEDVVPILVDTTFGRTQRQPYFGRAIHAGIAWGVRRSLRELS
jgi:hypothetical protein